MGGGDTAAISALMPTDKSKQENPQQLTGGRAWLTQQGNDKGPCLKQGKKQGLTSEVVP